jgi:Acetyltransferase (GNAT) domain
MISKYKCLKKNRYTIDGYLVLPLRNEDLFLIKEWRNKQIDILRQNGLLTDEDQRNYYDKTILSGFNTTRPQEILFSFLKDGKCIGYGGLVHIDWISNKAEISFLLDNNRIKNDVLYEKDFSIFLAIIKKVSFSDIELSKIYTETYDIRDHHISILEISGFKLVNTIKKNILIQDIYVDSLIHEYMEKYYEK